MNIDAGFFYQLLQNGDPRPLKKIQRAWLVPTWQQAYDFCLECVNNPDMQHLPTLETISEVLKGINFLETNEDIGFFIQQIRERGAYLAYTEHLREELNKVVATESNIKPLEILDGAQRGIASIRKTFRVNYGDEVVDFGKDTDPRFADYEERENKKGLLGIPFPFEPLNMCTCGALPGELFLFLAKSGCGKTWLLSLIAKHCYDLGYGVGFFSQEMRSKRAAMRLDAVMSGVSPKRFLYGELSIEEKLKLQQYYASLKTKKNELLLYGPNDIVDLEAFASTLSVIRNKISIVCWDSPYLCIRGNKNWEERASFVHNVKQLAEQYAIPIILTWQLNIDGNAAYTGAATTDADYNFLLHRNKQQEDTHQASMESRKTRDGMLLHNMDLEWNTVEGKFSVRGYDIPGMGDTNTSYAMDYTEEGMGNLSEILGG